MKKVIIVNGKCPNCGEYQTAKVPVKIYEEEMKKSNTGDFFNPDMPSCRHCGNTIKYFDGILTLGYEEIEE